MVEENEDLLFKKNKQIMDSLNINTAVGMSAWDSYQKIKTKFTLEGNQLHWLGCAMFVSCRRHLPQNNSSENSSVSLTTLLKSYDLSLEYFFDKIKKWMAMADVTDEFKRRIDSLQNCLAVSCNVFKIFVPMFTKIFKEPTDVEMSNRQRPRKQKSSPCTPSQLFELTWLLYITIKAENPNLNEDLVSCSQLLYSVCDVMFKNAFHDDRRDLLNEQFEGLNNGNFILDSSAEAPCIIDILCDSDSLTDAKYVKRYTFANSIDKVFLKAPLSGDVRTFCGLIFTHVFEGNSRNLARLYEEQLAKSGLFDERIFLAEHRRNLILKQHQNLTNGNSNDSADSEFNKSANETPRKIFDTPLTNRQYLGPRENVENNSANIGEQTVVKLQLLVQGRPVGPTDVLLEIFSSCSSSPKEMIENVLINLNEKFTEALEESGENVGPKLQFANQLFYRFLESILQQEQKLQSDITKLVAQEKFYECLYACVLEIMLKFHYNGKYEFPWILDALNIKAFVFIRVIELIVRSKSFSLPRETVKHLNKIEESILDAEIWKSESIVWEELKKPNSEIPKFEDIALPSNMIYGKTSKGAENADKNKNPLASPGPSALDTFNSPINQDNKSKMLVKPGQSLLSQNQKTSLHFLVTDPEGNKKLIPIESKFSIQMPPLQPTTIVANTPVEPLKPKKTGGFNIIFRKIYNLAGARLDHLCKKLDIEKELQIKIWTTFEHVLRNITELLKDRHLDQLLMCSVYVICKVTDRDINFSQIMSSYKEQPQATNRVYRNVLLFRTGEIDEKGLVLKEERRDNLIYFYNIVFIKPVTSFAVRFSSRSSQNSNIKLSPMPYSKQLLASPAHEIKRNLFIKKHESPSSNTPTNKSYNYYFNRSASKDLKDINRAINNNSVSKKRVINETQLNFEFVDAKRLCSNRKMQTLLEERRNQNSE